MRTVGRMGGTCDDALDAAAGARGRSRNAGDSARRRSGSRRSAGRGAEDEDAARLSPTTSPGACCTSTRPPWRRARFPVIDIHAHLGWAARDVGGVPLGEKMTFLAPPDALLKVMDRKNVETLVQPDRRVRQGPGRERERLRPAAPRPLPDLHRAVVEPGRTSRATRRSRPSELDRARKAGARGLKVLKTLGLYLREQRDVRAAGEGR